MKKASGAPKSDAGADPTIELLEKRVRTLESALSRQKAMCGELEKMVEDKTREIFLALETVRKQARLVGQHAATRELAEAGDLDSAAPRMLRAFCESLGWKVGVLWRADEQAGRLKCRTFVALGEERARFEASSRGIELERGIGLPGRVWADGRCHWIADVCVEPNFPRLVDARADKLHGACAFPIVIGNDVVAVIELLSEEIRSPDDDLLVALGALGTQIGQFLEKKQAEERVTSNERTIARRMQRMIAPRDLRVDGLEISAVVRAADAFGGDLYDVFPVAGGAYLAIGDVSGHGLLAGLIMLMVQSSLAGIIACRATASPSEIVAILNTVIFELVRTRLAGDDYVTFMLLRYADGGKISFAGAHEEILLFRIADRSIETVAVEGQWLGPSPRINASLGDRTLEMAEGDIIVLHTDGVTEARNAQRELFGVERLAAVIARTYHAPVEAIRDAIVDAVTHWMVRQDDDLTVMVLRRARSTFAASG